MPTMALNRAAARSSSGARVGLPLSAIIIFRIVAEFSQRSIRSSIVGIGGAASTISDIEYPRIQLEARRAFRPGVQIGARRADAGVSEGGLHFGQRGAVIEGVRGVGVPQPVGRDDARDASGLGDPLDEGGNGLARSPGAHGRWR